MSKRPPATNQPSSGHDPYREQAIMKVVEPVPSQAVVRYRRLHVYNADYHWWLRFQYKFNYQWFWHKKVFDLGSDHRYIPSNDELEAKVVKWLDLRARSGSL